MPLRSVRRAGDIPQWKVAQAIGCAASHYSNIERGAVAATPAHRAALVEFFSMPEEVLFDGLPEWVGPPIIPGIQQARMALGFSQNELAKRCKCTQNTISKLENGIVAPSPALRERLSKELQTPPLELFSALDKQIIAACNGRHLGTGVEAAIAAEAERQGCHPGYLRDQILKRKWGYSDEVTSTSL